MTIAKNGPKIKTTEAEGGVTTSSGRTHWHVEAKINMGRFAESLSDAAGRPVLDRTGLTGSYDITLDWTPDDAPANNDVTAGPSLYTALQEQLGLKLESTRGPVEMLVIDNANRVPTDN